MSPFTEYMKNITEYFMKLWHVKLLVEKANPAREWECNKLPLQSLLSSVSNIDRYIFGTKILYQSENHRN